MDRTAAPDPGLRGRIFQGLALSMLFAAFFGGLVLLDGWFSRRLLHDPERTVREATTVIMVMFWPGIVVMYVARIRKSAAQCRFERQAQLVEEERVYRVRRLLQEKQPGAAAGDPGPPGPRAT